MSFSREIKNAKVFVGYLQRGVVPGRSRKGKRTEGGFVLINKKGEGENKLAVLLIDAKRKQGFSASLSPLPRMQRPQNR
jgi:hypothetical protein